MHGYDILRHFFMSMVSRSVSAARETSRSVSPAESAGLIEQRLVIPEKYHGSEVNMKQNKMHSVQQRRLEKEV